MRPVTFGEEEEQVSNTEVTQKSSNKKGGWSFADIGSCYDFLRADESNFETLRRCLYELRGIDSRTIRFKKDWRCSVCFANLSSKRNFQIYYEDLHKETRYDVGWYPDMPLPKYTVMENPWFNYNYDVPAAGFKMRTQVKPEEHAVFKETFSRLTIIPPVKTESVLQQENLLEMLKKQTPKKQKQYKSARMSVAPPTLNDL